MPGFAHQRLDSLAAVKDGGDVQVHDFLEILRLVSGQRLPRRDARVVDQNINAAERLACRLDRGLYCVKVRQIRRKANDGPVCVFCFQRSHSLFCCLHPAAAQCDLRAVL